MGVDADANQDEDDCQSATPVHNDTANDENSAHYTSFTGIPYNGRNGGRRPFPSALIPHRLLTNRHNGLHSHPRALPPDERHESREQHFQIIE